MDSKPALVARAGGTKKRVFLLASAVVLALAPSRVAPAQTDVTTGRITGYVRDASGTPLTGAAVTGRNDATGHSAAAISGSDGFYQLIDLPTGSYAVAASLKGFGTRTRPGVKLILGSSPSVDFVLEVSSVSENVTVTSAVPVVEVTSTAVSTTLQAEQLKNLPVSGRDFKNLVLLTPQTRIESERGLLSIGGERGINTSITVDGMDFNNPFFGGSVAHAEGRAPLSLSLESIQEFTVITNGASVEFGRSGGGFVNVITRSGTNTVHGSGFFYWQPRGQVADFANGTPPGDQERKQFGASLGGPLAKDRLFLFGSFDQQQQHLTIPINPSVLEPAIFAKYPVLAGPSEYVQGRDGWVAFGRLDWQMLDTQHLMGRVNDATYDGVNGTNSSPNDTLQHNGIEGMKSLQLVATLSGQFGRSVINDLNFNYTNEDTPRRDKNLNLPEIRLGAGPGAALYGEVSSLPIVSTARRYEVSDTLTWLVKNHAAKIGFDYNDTSVAQIFKGSWRGVFFFNNTADLLAGRYSQYLQFGGLGGLTADEAGLASFGQREYAGFLQDQWFVNPKLTVTLGVRYEFLNNPDAPVLNPAAALPSGQFPLNARIPDATDQWSPRFGISFAPDPQTAVRLTAGRYWSRTPGLLFAQLFARNGLRGVLYATPNTAGQNPTDPNCRVGTTSCYDPLAPPWGTAFTPVGVERVNISSLQPGTPGLPVFAIDPNFTNPHTDRLTFSVEREVLPGVSAQVQATWARTHNLERLTDANRVYDGTTAVNGQPRYSSTRPNPFYTSITEYKSDARGEYKALVFQASKRFTSNFGASVAITYSQDKDSDSNERNFAGVQAEDFNDLNGSYSWSNRDQRWRATANAVWQSPWWGVGVAGGVRFNTGSAYTGLASFDFNNDGQSGTDRPTLGCTSIGGSATNYDCSNGTHLKRNSYRQPSFYALDIRLQKGFRVGPGDLSFAVDCFNCTNTGNKFVSQTIFGRVPGPTVGNITLPNTSTPNANFGNPNNPGTPFTGQVSVRYDF